MLNIGLRTGKLLGVLNSDIDIEKKTMTIRQVLKLLDQRNGTKCADGSIKTLNIKAVADILGHTTTEITERYYVKKDTSRLTGITDGFEL